jgi:hypothetical protein
MLETIELLEWILEIDFVRTYNFYNTCHLITDDCKCTDCLNYVRACALIPEKNVLSIYPLYRFPLKRGSL